MTEDIALFVNHTHGDPWRISGHDAELIQELHQALRAWLPAFRTGKEVQTAGQVLQDLEMLSLNGSAPAPCEVEVYRMDATGCGLSVAFSIGRYCISLSVIKLVPGPNGAPDHATVLDHEGLPISLTLDDMGSFDRDRFEAWWHHAMNLAPVGPIQPSVSATIKRDDE